MTDDLAALSPDLASLGWDAELDQWASALPHEHRGRIARTSRGFCLVFTGQTAVLAASSSIRSDTGIAPSTGDFVTVIDHPDDGLSIGAVAERRTVLVRRAPGRVPEPQVLAANADDVFVMHGLDRPVNLNRLERQLVIAWAGGATPVVILTKADEVAHHEEAVETIRRIAPGVETIAISTVSGQNLDRVRSHFTGSRTIVLMGLSGIGKSTLVNELSSGVVQRTGEVRATDRRGRHTTVTRDLIPLPEGGIVIDTPGIREIGLWQADAGIERVFPEIVSAATHCRFADCTHVKEPGCGIQAAHADGLITERRLQHWRELQAELDLQAEQLEEFGRRAESRSRADVERRRDGERKRKPPKGKRKGKRR
jgi:ribosome biogenesis GTPase